MSVRWQIAQWFELRWWRRYLSGRDKEKYYSWKKQYWNDLLKQIGEELPYKEANSIADLGCGPAGIFIAFENKKVIAADPLLDTYEKTLPFFDKNDFPHTTFINQKLEDFRPSEKFDIVFCMNAINHVADINVAYDRLANAAKDGGHIVVSIDAHNHSFFKKLFRLIPGDILHPHQYDLEEYCDFMTKRSCVILKKHLVKKEFFFSHYVLVGKR
jgi:SAM-dependent methyltransferase